MLYEEAVIDCLQFLGYLQNSAFLISHYFVGGREEREGNIEGFKNGFSRSVFKDYCLTVFSLNADKDQNMY